MLSCFCPVMMLAEDTPQNDEVVENVVVDFETQIRPILQRRCLKCHNAEKSEGGLRLDSKSLAEQGGHTGNSILSADPEESELFQRIISDDDQYRMPAESPPLPASEIQIIKRWLTEGADWPESKYEEGESSLPGKAKRYYDRFVAPIKNEYDRNSRYLAFLGFPLVAYLAFLFICEKARRKKAASSYGKLADFKRTWHAIVLLCFSLAGTWLYYHGALLNSESKIEQLTRENWRIRGELFPSWKDEYDVPMPPKRRHPKRLGGVYFRGNDERDARLFNGGYYRTATLSVWLSDSQGRRLEWNDDVLDDDLYISVEINRARNATPALFRPQVMKLMYLSRQVPASESEEYKDSPIQFIPVEEGESWIAHYPIKQSASPPNKNLKGIIYVYQGKLDGNRITGKIHYGIEYDLIFESGKVSPNSSVWMGSIFNLAGKLLIPADNRIVLGEWFDFRPIPEIEGENTTDPKLLGITEHEAEEVDRNNNKSQ